MIKIEILNTLKLLDRKNMPYFKDGSINVSKDWIMCFVYTEVEEIKTYSVTGKRNSLLVFYFKSNYFCVREDYL